jgi:hydrogenase large subunit
MHDHIVHFYHLSALDWVDVVSALKATRRRPPRLPRACRTGRGNSRMQLTGGARPPQGFVDSGQLGIFQNGYWGHPAMKLAPEVNLLAVSHYLEALEYQRKVNQVVAILGGKTPNIQNLAVGGVANAINLDNQATLNMEKLYQVKDILDEVQDFIRQVYFVDVCAIGAMYADWLSYGKGVTNYLSVPDLPLDTKGTQFDFPGGAIMNGDLGHVQEIKTFNETFFKENVTECIARAWYDGDWTKHPFDETTEPEVHEVRRQRQVLVGQGAALQGAPDAGRAARAGAGRVRARPQAHRCTGRPRRSRPPARLRKRR